MVRAIHVKTLTKSLLRHQPATISWIIILICSLILWLLHLEMKCPKDVSGLKNLIANETNEVKNRLNLLATNHLFIEKLSTGTYTYEDFVQLRKLPFDVFIARNDSIVFWSKNRSVISAEDITKLLPEGFVKLKNGYFFIAKHTIPSLSLGHIDVVGVLPLQNKYIIENQYLKEIINPELAYLIPCAQFTETPSSENSKALDPEEQRIYLQVSSEVPPPPKFTWLVSLLLTCTLLYCFWQIILAVRRRYGLMLSFSVWAGILLLGLYSMARYDYPIVTAGLSIFKTPLFQIKSYDLSFGQVILLLITLGLMSLGISNLFPWDWIQQQKTNVRWWVMFVVCVIFFALTAVYLHCFYYLLYFSDTSLSADNFVFLNTFSLSLFFTLGFIIYTQGILTHVIYTLYWINNKKWNVLLTILLISALPALLVLFVCDNYLSVAYLVGWLMMLMIIVVYQQRRLLSGISSFSQKFLLFMLVLAVFWSGFLVSIKYKKDDKSFKEYAQEVLRQEDQETEWHFRYATALKIIDEDTLFHLLQAPPREDTLLMEYVKNKYLSSYLKDYYINMAVFDVAGKYISGDTIYTFNEINAKIAAGIQMRLAVVDNNKSGDTQSTSILAPVIDDEGKYNYLTKLPIFLENGIGGFLVLFFERNVKSSPNVYPELLIAERFRNRPEYLNHDYAVYRNRALLFSRDNFSFFPKWLPSMFTNKDTKEGDVQNGDIQYHYRHVGKATTVVVSKAAFNYFDKLSFFSYTLFMCLLGLSFFLLLSLLWNDDTGKKIFRQLFFSSLTRRISGVTLMVVVLSFVAIVFVTVFYFSNRSLLISKEKLLQKQNTIGLLIEEELNTNADWLKNAEKVGNTLFRISESQNADINLYTPQGYLINTSQPIIFDVGIISKLMNPEALERLRKRSEPRIVIDESAGNLKYLSAYKMLYNAAGKEAAIVHIPDFAQEKNLKQDISRLIGALINVYLLVLVAAGVLAVLVSSRLTSSLKLIGEKLKHIRIGQENEKLEWPHHDEIGDLVQQYNAALDRLEHSANQLAYSERQSAWQSMARQIAHEIKNPLTPMKLAIQHLQRAERENHPQLRDMIQRVSNNLIEQIDHLAYIASEFSSFAKMPQQKLEVFDFKEVLLGVIDLYKENTSQRILRILPESPVLIVADKNQLHRVFQNLLRNAQQAIPENRQGIIIVKMLREGSYVVASVTDNGVGINEEQSKQVFVPNFTTKSSGMGLGLAMSKNIIDSLKGKIYFESEVDKGTTFFVKLPLYHSNGGSNGKH